MHVFYVPDPDAHHLPEDEAGHAVRTLRLKAGAAIALTDGAGGWCTAQLTATKPATFTVTRRTRVPRPAHYIHLAVAPTKNHDRLEWLVEKATEIGVQEISFVKTLKTERKNIQIERLRKIAIAAIKQSQQAWLPKINDLLSLEQALRLAADVPCIAHASEAAPAPHLARVAPPGKKYLVLIGPEGDFTQAELEQGKASGFSTVNLGPHRLRTETAALAACLALNLVNA